MSEIDNTNKKPKPKSGGIPIGQWSGSDATDRLTAVIIDSNEETKRQTAKMVTLTQWITYLTIALVCFGFVLLIMVWVQLKLIVN